MSTSNRHPNAKSWDYKWRGKYASVNIDKDLTDYKAETLYISITSKIGLNILFAYWYDRDPPPSDIVKNNLGMYLNIYFLESRSYLEALSQPRLTTKQIIHNKINDILDDYEKHEDLMDEVITINSSFTLIFKLYIYTNTSN